MRHFVLTNSSRRPRRVVSRRIRTAVAGISTLVLGVTLLPLGLVTSADAGTAPVGQGFNVTKSDLAYILKQIKIAERHVRTTTGDRTVRLAARRRPRPGAEPAAQLRSAHRRRLLQQPAARARRLRCRRQALPAARAGGLPPRRGSRSVRPARARPPTRRRTANVVDSQPRLISNLIVDQTSTNPAAVSAAAYPVRTQGNPGVEPCDRPRTATPVATASPAGADPVHPERDDRRRPLAALQLAGSRSSASSSTTASTSHQEAARHGVRSAAVTTTRCSTARRHPRQRRRGRPRTPVHGTDPRPRTCPARTASSAPRTTSRTRQH